ncbi:unnamed protein product [Choristocarpus tenellus]
MATYKLTYFDFAGRAEPIRQAFVIAGIPFEDKRVSFAEFGAMKESGDLRWGTVPSLDIVGTDGKTTTISQSMAILRFVSRKGGLYPADPIEAAMVDEILDALQDMNNAIVPSVKEPDAEKKAAMRVELAKTLVQMFERFEKRYEENGSNGWAVGASISAADLALFENARWTSTGILDGIPTTILDTCPQVKGLRERVLSNSKIAKYYASKQ